MSTSHNTAEASRRGTVVLLALALMVVQPIIFVIVRIIIGEFRFDGASILSLLAMLSGAWILRRVAAKDVS